MRGTQTKLKDGPTTPKPPGPKRLNRDQRRERIIEAAIDLFSKNSYEDTKIDEIAAAADCTTGPVYHFFAGKEDIFLAAYQTVAERYGVVLQEILARESPPLEKILAICNGFHDLPGHQASEFARSGLRVLGYKEVLRRQGFMRTQIQKLLNEAMIDGTIQPAPPEPLAHLIFGMAIEALSLVGIANDTDKASYEYKNAIASLILGLRLR